MKLCKFKLWVNKHATNDTIRGKLGKLPLLLKIMLRRPNFYDRANSLDENDLIMHACNSNWLWFSLLDKITGKYQGTTEHHTFGSPTDSAPILNNMMTTYESLWYQNITGSAENKFRTYSSFKTKFRLEPYIIYTGATKFRNITRLRISCHPLAVETGRCNKPKTPLDKDCVTIVTWAKLKMNIIWFICALSTLTKETLC